MDSAYALNKPLLQRAKIHLILHLPDSMLDFGPTRTFNTERSSLILNYLTHNHVYCRCEHMNGIIRSQNIHSNRQASSRDIAMQFMLSSSCATLAMEEMMQHQCLELNCNILRLTNKLSAVPVSHEVSLVHECLDTCVFCDRYRPEES